MELNVVIAETLRQATVEAIKNVKISNDLDLNNFIVVPDRFSLLAEKLIPKRMEEIENTYEVLYFICRSLGLRIFLFFRKKPELRAENPPAKVQISPLRPRKGRAPEFPVRPAYENRAYPSSRKNRSFQPTKATDKSSLPA